MNDLFKALEIADIAGVEKALWNGADFKMLNEEGDTVVAAACDHSNEFVKQVISLGADVRLLDVNGRSPLYRAVIQKRPELLRLLLGHGCDLSIEEPHDGDTSLHLAARLGVEECIIIFLHSATAAQLNQFDSDGKSPLIYASMEGHLECVQRLVEAGADINAHDESVIGETALHYAIRGNQQAVQEYLIKRGASVDIPGWMKITPRMLLAERPS